RASASGHGWTPKDDSLLFRNSDSGPADSRTRNLRVSSGVVGNLNRKWSGVGNDGPTLPQFGIERDIADQRFPRLDNRGTREVFVPATGDFGDGAGVPVGVGPFEGEIAVTPGIPFVEMPLWGIRSILNDDV